MTHKRTLFTLLWLSVFAFFSISLVLKFPGNRSDHWLRERQWMGTMNANLEETPRGCLSLNEGGDMDSILSRYKQVFVVMPAKASGSSLKLFTKRCMKNTSTKSFAVVGNIVNKPSSLKEAFVSQIKTPSLVTSHVLALKHLLHLIKHVTSQSLIIYSHREETSRTMSAIKQVVAAFCARNERAGVTVLQDSCQITETELVNTIEKRLGEIHFGATQLLTCETFESIAMYRPKLVFFDYAQASKLMGLLAKHHCPGVADEMVNIGSQKKPIHVVLDGANKNGTLIDISEWLSAKKNLIEYVLGMRHDASCVGTIRKLEYDLLSCHSATLDISEREF